MEMDITILITLMNQILKMFLLIAVGYILYKKKTIDEHATEKLSSILISVAMPATIITSFNQTFSSDKLFNLLLTVFLSFLMCVVSAVVAKVIYKEENQIEKFAVVFSNAGFIGIPLVTGLLGIGTVLYIAIYLVSFILFSWTYGVLVMSGNKDNITFKKIATNPCVISVILGVVIFIMPVKPALPIMEAVSSIGGLNTPLAMIVLGSHLAKSDITKIFGDKRVYSISFNRLILLPLIALGILYFVPNTYHEIKMVILIGTSAPTGATLPIFAQLFGRDTEYSARIVSVSTILSGITIPIIILLAQMIW